jgi:hypothetical protein
MAADAERNGRHFDDAATRPSGLPDPSAFMGSNPFSSLLACLRLGLSAHFVKPMLRPGLAGPCATSQPHVLHDSCKRRWFTARIG